MVRAAVRVAKFASFNLEVAQAYRAKRGYQWDVWHVSASADDNAPRARFVHAGVERPPTSVEKGFEPRAEIHKRLICGNPNIGKVPENVPGWDVECPAVAHCDVIEVAANDPPLCPGFGRARLRSR